MYFLTQNNKVVSKASTKSEAIDKAKEMKGEVQICEMVAIKTDVQKPVVKLLNI